MLKKQMMRQGFIMLVALVLIISSLTPVQAVGNKHGQLESTYTGEGYQVTYEITSHWGVAFNAEVRIENLSNKVIDNWAIGFELPHEISNIWNGVVHTHDNHTVVIKNAKSNQDIEVGKSVSFGFTAQANGEVFIPDVFNLLGTEQAVPLDQFDVSFIVTSDWGSAFNGELRVTNNSQAIIEDWSLQFEYDGNIEQFWIAEIVDRVENRYTIKNAGYNANIKPGETLALGFAGNPGNVEYEPSHYQLNQVVVGQEPSQDVLIHLDTTGMEYEHSSEGDFYFLNETKNFLSGSLEGSSRVQAFSYQVTDINTEVLQQGNIVVDNDWSVEGIGFGIGYNMLKLTATLRNGTEITNEYAIVNFDESNLRQIGIDLSVDSDDDGIPDYYEQRIGLSPNSSDSDGDGLNDLIELIVLKTDPLLPDSNDNGILDGYEDHDGDGLNNLTELELGTSPINPDTDGDGLTDGDEIHIYNTDPLNPDTDGDGLSDGWEIEIGSNPLVYDKKFSRTVSAQAEHAKTIPSATVEGISAEHVHSLAIYAAQDGLLDDTTIPGYIDHGYKFSINGPFEKATIAFEFDESLLSAEDFVPRIYYFDEDTQLLEELPNQQVSDNVVSVETTHFSKYILLNKTEHEKVWIYQFLYDESEEDPYAGLDVVFVIDSSGSMTSNDRNNVRIDVTREFINRLSDNDRGAIVDFDSSATVLSDFTSDKATLLEAAGRIDSSGGTSLTSGISSALNLYTGNERTDALKYIIMLTDGQGSYNTSLTTQAANRDIIIYTVGLGSGVSEGVLTAMAQGTGGSYYHASNADQLYGIFDTIAETSDLYKDTDGDGISDYHEKELQAGRLRLGTGGTMVKVNYLNPDSDGDGLLDGEELRINKIGDRVYAYLYSNPSLQDTDDDGWHDSVDPRPLVPDKDEALIHQSSYREGILKTAPQGSNNVSDDLTFNDFSFTELLDLGLVFSVAPITPEFLMWDEMAVLFAVGKFGASSDMKDVLDDMLWTFRHGNRHNEGTTVADGDIFNSSKYIKYKNSKLDNAVINDPSTQNYLDLIKTFVVEQLQNNKGNLFLLEYDANSSSNVINNYVNRFSTSPYPVFTERTNLALALAIHGFHGHNISIKNFKNDGEQFSGTLVFHFYDHFGLDTDDEIHHFGFIDWFTLQHYDRFNGKYVPFITTIDHELEFSGVLK